MSNTKRLNMNRMPVLALAVLLAGVGPVGSLGTPGGEDAFAILGALPVVGDKGTHAIDPASFAAAYDSVILDAAALREQALTTGKVSLQLFGKTYALQLTPINDLAPGATATMEDANGMTVTLPPLPVILFDVAAPDGVSGWLSLPGDWVQGEIVDGITIYLEPKTRQDSSNAVETIAYRHSDLLPISEVGEGAGSPEPESHERTELLPYSVALETPELPEPKPMAAAAATSSSSGSGGSGGGGKPYCGHGGPFYPNILVNVDPQYAAIYGSATWTNQVRTVIAGVNEVYTPICTTHMIDTMQMTRIVDDNNWNTAKSQWFETPRPSHIGYMVHFSGRDYDGCTVGEADSTPGWYTINQQRSDFCHGNRGDALADQIYIPRHELGHNHNGVHTQADYWYDGAGEHRTIMGASFAGIIENFFSYGNEPCSGENCRDPVRDPSHNNRKRIHSFTVAAGG